MSTSVLFAAVRYPRIDVRAIEQLAVGERVGIGEQLMVVGHLREALTRAGRRTSSE